MMLHIQNNNYNNCFQLTITK